MIVVIGCIAERLLSVKVLMSGQKRHAAGNNGLWRKE